VTATKSCRLRYFLFGVVTGPIMLTMLGIIIIRLNLSAIGYWLERPVELGQADAIVVLGGGWPERMLYGVTLYRQGWAPELWFTGNLPIPATSSFTAEQLVRDFASAQDVPGTAIRLLPTTNTWEDGREIATLARQEDVQSIIVVTDWHHSRRALCVIRKWLTGSNVTVFFSSPPILTSSPDNWWHYEEGLVAVTNELIKTGYYWWRYDMIPWQC